MATCSTPTGLSLIKSTLLLLSMLMSKLLIPLVFPELCVSGIRNFSVLLTGVFVLEDPWTELLLKSFFRREVLSNEDLLRDRDDFLCSSTERLILSGVVKGSSSC